MGLELWKEVIIIPALALVTSNWLNFCLSFCSPYSLSWVNNDPKSLFSSEHVCPVVPFPVWKSGLCQLVNDLWIILEAILKSSICLHVPVGALEQWCLQELCWPHHRLTSAARFSFTSIQFTWDVVPLHFHSVILTKFFQVSEVNYL